MDVPCGYCHCGCGEKTRISPRNHKRYGWIAGVPVDYITGHNRRRERHSKYVKVHCPTHPNCDVQGYVYEHMLVAEKFLGRNIGENEIIHHKDGDTKNNDPQNLVVLGSHSEHATLHNRERAEKECGHANWRKCCFCHQYDNPQNLKFSKNERSAYHSKCHATYHRERKAKIRNAA